MSGTDWNVNREYFKGYDAIQMNSSRYKSMLNWFSEQLIDSQTVLEAGAGTGNLTKILGGLGKEILALDINPWALKILEEKCTGFNVKTKVLDLAQEMSFENQYDAATSMIVLPFPSDVRTYCSNVYDSLKEGGKFVISSWAAVPDIFHGVIELTERELYANKTLPNYLASWQRIKDDGEVFAQEVIKRDLSLDSLLEVLDSVGFVDFEVFDSHYNEKYTYPIVCKKG